MTNILIDKEKIKKIITEAYKQIEDKENGVISTKTTAIENIVNYMMEVLKEDAVTEH